MFEKSKVKGYNRLSKSKSGFKVIRVKDFLRKKDDNKKRNLAIGVGATAVLGIGAGLLLKRKGVGLTSLKNNLKSATRNTPKYPKGTNVRAKDMVVNVKASKVFDKIENPWDTPIQYRVSKDLLRPSRRRNLTKKSMLVVSDKKKAMDSITNMRNTQKNYDSLPLPMKVTLQMEKALTRPIKSSNLGKQLDTKGLKVILGDSEKLPIEKVISRAKRKVGDRLKRQNEELAKKT